MPINRDRNSRKRILVSSSLKLYVHELLYALQKYQWDYLFVTSFWYKPEQFPFFLVNFFPGKIRGFMEREFRKKYDKKLKGENIKQFPWFELIRELSDKLFLQRFAERMLFYRDRIHDRFVASRLNTYEPDIVVGYEESCLLTFRKAKEKGRKTILDLAQVHYREIIEISDRYPAFGDLYKNKKLRSKIDLIKEEELSLADYVICLSDFAKDTLVKNGISPKKIFVANLGIDPLTFNPKQSYESSGKLKVVFAGTLTKRKGIDLLLKIKREIPDTIDLTFIGPMGDARDLFEGYPVDYTHHPYVEQKRLNALLNQSDVFVFPSYLDSWGMVVVEAMASGLPVIVSDNTGAKEAVSDECGFCVPTGNYCALKEKIMHLNKFRNELKSKGENARKNALAYAWENYYRKIDHIMSEISGSN